jgi:phosphatidate cytidylyltransferase
LSDTEPRPGTPQAAKRTWTDLGPRFASALVLLALTAAGLYIGSYVFAALVGAVFAGCYREWERMVTLKPLTPVGGTLIGLLAAAALVYPWLGPAGSIAVIAAACVVAVAADRSVAVWRVGGLVFLGAIIIAAVALRGTTGLGALAGVFLGVTVWLTDTGAFFTGRQIGGEKLAPDISPGKTWSGAIGGLALGTLGGLVAWLVIVPASPWWIGLHQAPVPHQGLGRHHSRPRGVDGPARQPHIRALAGFRRRAGTRRNRWHCRGFPQLVAAPGQSLPQ